MRVLSQLLGRYSDTNKPLILFRLPDTDTLFYRTSDIEPLFHLSPMALDKDAYKNCYKDHEDTYLNTCVLAKVAEKYNCPRLADLCKLTPNDYNEGIADPILQTFPKFKRAPKEEHIWESVQLPLEKLEDIMEREDGKEIKAEPTSPPLLISQSRADTKNAMALDKVLLNSSDLRRHSLLDMEHPASKRQKVGSPLAKETTGISAASTGRDRTQPQSTVNSQPASGQLRKVPSYSVSSPEHDKHQQQSQGQQQQHLEASTWKKRMPAKQKNARNLTIFAPSYNEDLAGVRSAPINSHFNKVAIPPQQQQHHNRAQQAKNGIPTILYHHSLAPVPATATIARPPPFAHQPSHRRHEYAVPPIVPSQQQPPHSAHPTSREAMAYQQYLASPNVYGNSNGHHTHAQQNGSSSYSHTQRRKNESQPQLAVTAANVPLPPKTPTTNSFAALQRQQYLQPFEHLFETIETTRTLKNTLDDQIRRSSSLMQTLQASATTLEGLVRNQIKEAQWDMMSQVEKTVDELMQRIDSLEKQFDRSEKQKQKHTPTSTSDKTANKVKDKQQSSGSLLSPLPSATKEERAIAEELVAFAENGRENGVDSPVANKELQAPPTIVRSQNDIGPQEYNTMLNTLRDRLDRLERQIET